MLKCKPVSRVNLASKSKLTRSNWVAEATSFKKWQGGTDLVMAHTYPSQGHTKTGHLCAPATRSCILICPDLFRLSQPAQTYIAQTYIGTYIHMHIYTYYMYMCIYIYIYIHTNTGRSSLSKWCSMTLGSTRAVREPP